MCWSAKSARITQPSSRRNLPSAIDRARAIIAIDVIGDWQSYDDPHLCIVMRLLAPVVSKLNERAEFSIEPLTVAAETRLADWLANLIITNEEQIRHRRNEFVKLPSL